MRLTSAPVVPCSCADGWKPEGWAYCAECYEGKIERIRSEIIEECAKVLDEAAQDWRRIRDPGMANNAGAYAKRIRDLSLTQANQDTAI